jgi:hypothetical protein
VTITQTEIQDRIVAKAGEDGEFRARLVADPRTAIHDLTGTPVPDAFTVQVHEESATSFHLVLPPDSRLTEEEMSQVFAGDWAWDWAQAQQQAWS